MEGSSNELQSIYYNPKSPGSFGSLKKLFDQVKKIDPSIKLKDVEDWLFDQDTYNLFRRSIKKFPRLPILVDYIDEQWQADLMDMTWIAKFNKGNKYLLTVIDCLSRYAWAVPIKDKSAVTILSAFKLIFEKSKRSPDKIQTDQGKEFVNQYFKRFVKSKGIHHFTSTDDVIKCAIVERFNRTLRNRIYRFIHYSNSPKYFHVLNAILDGYNNSYHRTIKMTPTEALNDEEAAKINIHKAQRKNLKKQKPYQVGDTVRIARAKAVFEKGATTNWTQELFKIIKVKWTPQGYIYRLEDWGGEPITSVFYHDEVFAVTEPTLYKIEKIIRSRVNSNTKKKEYFVKWLGYPDKFNSWVQDVS